MLKIEGLYDDARDEEVSGRGLAKSGAEDARGSFEDVQGRDGLFEITKLTQGVRDQQRVNVFIDGKFAFSLDVAQVVDYGLKIHQKIDAARLEELRGASEFGKLYQRTLEWVLVRPRSVRETRDYLRQRQAKRKAMNRQRAAAKKRVRSEAAIAREGSGARGAGFEGRGVGFKARGTVQRQVATKPLPEMKDETMELVVARLIEKNYLDDERFARYFVENRNVRKGASRRKLEIELRQKGVSEEIIAAALDGARPESEEIQKMIQKKRARYDDQKLTAYLLRQGFSLDAIRRELEKGEED